MQSQPRLQEALKKTLEAFENGDISIEEINEIVDYTEYLLKKRRSD
jgi:hypothetical protein